jgi:1,2-phenylacetyl-CoA epoxidase catalytic subunit
MLVAREDLRFSFQGAQFDLNSDSDRKLLAWIFNQFLYGEVTGIQCGHWLYQAPTLNAATFIARQASEELAHVRKILRIFSHLGEKPGKAHWAIRFLATGMMGSSWGEHVTLEMALGEGLVLGVFYAMADTIPDSEIHKILIQAAAEEERHVEFGERETEFWIKAHPETKNFLLAQALVQMWVLQKLKRFVVKQVAKQLKPDHPVLSRLEEFYDHTLHCFEVRLEKLGLCSKPLRQLTLADRLRLILPLPFRVLREKLRSKPPLLTETYLSDPALEAEAKRFLLSSVKPE